MSKKKKIEEGLNRLFSSSQSRKSESPHLDDLRDLTDNSEVRNNPEVNETNLKIKEASAEEKLLEDQLIPPSDPVRPIENEQGLKKETSQVISPVKDEIHSLPEEKEPSTPHTEVIAQPPVEHKFEDEQVVIFALSNQLFGINISMVESIIKMQPITELPRAKDYVRGVTNLRGRVVPVFNLSTQLDLPQNEISNSSRIVIVNISGYDAGIVVDEVKSVTQINGKDINLPTDMLSVNSKYVRAIARVENSLLILLELNEVFTFQFGNVK